MNWLVSTGRWARVGAEKAFISAADRYINILISAADRYINILISAADRFINILISAADRYINMLYQLQIDI